MKKKSDPLQRTVQRLADHFEDAACIAIILNIDRDMFLEMAAKAFDWNQDLRQEFLEEENCEEEKPLQWAAKFKATEAITDYRLLSSLATDPGCKAGVIFMP